ncbi:MAG: FAD-dependent oxidoreductase [Luteolibacter sp.]
MYSIRKSSSSSSKGNVVVVGNGIASLRFCEEAVSNGLAGNCKITVLGGEPLPAYDRVRLSQYVKDKSAEGLIFHPKEWYVENGIDLHVGDEVAALYPESKKVVTGTGVEYFYDDLVLATGSSAFVPPVPGIEFPGVFVYRTLDDLDRIISVAKNAKTAAVIGGGLLGLEAAQALSYLGLSPTIIERADFPMPRQLNATAGAMIREKVEGLGLTFRGNFSTKEILKKADGLELLDEHGGKVMADIVLVSAGISPNSGIAEEAGLPCGVRGGVIVNDLLETEDGHIHAVGECALHHGNVYGLAAPAGEMARYVARKLAGVKQQPFQKPDLSTRLKMLGVEVVTIGSALDKGEIIEFSAEDGYRLVTLNVNRVPVGALGIGGWEESNLLQGWYLEGRALRPKEIESFRESGLFQPEAAGAGVTQWPDERLICNCMQISKGAVCHAMASGACSPDLISEKTGAGTVCGSCVPLLEELCGAPVTKRRGVAPMLLIVVAAIALLVAVSVLFVKVPNATSVDSLNYQLDRFWEEAQPKQITGYSLLGVTAFGLLISLRKRLPKFRIGAFVKWRVFHSAFGLISLIALFAHTGFRFGSNLNATLMAVFVGLNLLGAVAGIAAGLETRGSPKAAMLARRVRPGLTIAHYVLFWPLPVLLGFHIASAYIY